MTKPDQKTRIRLIVTNLIFFGLLLGLVSLNKAFLRPAFNHIPPVRFLTGSFPNFIAAFLISLSVVNPVLLQKPKYGRLIVYAGSIVVFIILAIEEIRPMWGASTYYDIYDIFASGTGSLLAIISFELLLPRQKPRKHT